MRLGLSALLMGTTLFGALEFSPPEVLSSDGVVSGDGSAAKTKLVGLGNGLLIAVYGDAVASQHDVYDLKDDAVRKARDIFVRTCKPTAANSYCSSQSDWTPAVNISNTADSYSISTRWRMTASGLGPEEPYYGDSEKPNIFSSGNFAVVTWIDKYCDETEQRIVSYNERNGLSLPFSCVYESHINFADATPTWVTSRLTRGIRDAKQDLNRGVSMGSPAKGKWVITWQEDPHGLQIGNAEGPGDGSSGAKVTHGTDIWYTYTEDLMAGFTNTPTRLTDNFTNVGGGGNTNPVFSHDGTTEITALETGSSGASRANTAVVALTTGETVPTAIVAYEETKGSSGLDEGKFVRYHAFAFNTPDVKQPGAIISDPEENSRRVRFVTQTKPSADGMRMGILWRQGNAVEGGPADIMVRLGFKTSGDSASTGLRAEDMVPAVDANARTSVYAEAIALSNAPAYNISSNTIPWTPVGGAEEPPTNTLADTTDKNIYEDARAHRAVIRGDDFHIGYTYTKDWAVSRYTDMENYNFWVRRYNAVTNSWSVAKNLSGVTDKKINVKEPRLVGMPGNGPGCTDPANITDPENCQNKSVLIAAWGVESNVYDHIGGAVDGDIYYTRTRDKGESYSPTTVVEGIGSSYRAESQLRTTPAGNLVFAVWNETSNEAGLGGSYTMFSVSASDDGTVIIPPPPEDDVVPLQDNDTAEKVFGTVDDTSLLLMILGFLAIGAVIARRKLSPPR